MPRPLSPVLGFRNGFAKNKLEAAFPNHWDQLRGLWVPGAGTQARILRDLSGYRNHATFVVAWEGGIQRLEGYQGGRHGSCIYVDGISDHALATDKAILNISSTQMTLSAWVKTEDTGNHQNFLCKPKTNGSHDSPYFSYSLQGFYANSTSVTPRLWLSLAGVGLVATSAVTIIHGRWNHLAGTYDGATMRIYVNGIQQGTSAQTAAITAYATDFRIGANGGNDERACGALDDMRLYGRCLRPSEIWEIFEGISPLLKRKNVYGNVASAQLGNQGNWLGSLIG